MTDRKTKRRSERETLVRKAALLTRKERFEDAVKIFEEHLPELSSGTDKDKIVAASVFSYYGLCIAALRKQYADGVKYCQLSLKVQSSNPEHYENQARIHLLGRSRGRAVDALFEGLSHDPKNKPINHILNEIGRRRPPVIGFLPRNNALNVYLGKKRHERFEARRAKAMQRRRKTKTGPAGAKAPKGHKNNH